MFFEAVVVVVAAVAVAAVDHSLVRYDDFSLLTLTRSCCVHLQGDRRRLLEDRGMQLLRNIRNKSLNVA